MTAAPRNEEISEAPCVVLELTSEPETLTLVRTMLSAVGEAFAIDPELLDDLKTAISEACNNVVLHAYAGDRGPLSIELFVLEEAVAARIRDRGRGIEPEDLDSERHSGVGIPVIGALSDWAEFNTPPGGGTEVFMSFVAERDGRRLFIPPLATVENDGWTSNLDGDAVVSVSPLELLGTLLGRLARASAASAKFSLDRFSDVYLVTDAVAAHAATAAMSDRIAFAISGEDHRLELAIGPLRSGTAQQIQELGALQAGPSPLKVLSDEVSANAVAESGELLRILMLDRQN